MQAIMETIFESAYLSFAIIAGILILIKSKKDKRYLLLGLSVLLLGLGDSFHLIPRMIGLISNNLNELNVALGIGKLITSITMTLFYLLMYYFLKIYFKESETPFIIDLIYVCLVIVRIGMCSMPQNEWVEKNPNYTFSIIRNIPFVIIGLIFIITSYRLAKNHKYFKWIWLLVSLSFIFYLMTVIAAPFNSIFGLMMLPKTICYVIIIILSLIEIKNSQIEEL